MMDSFERKGIMLAVGAHIALAGGMGAAFLFAKKAEAEEPPPVEVSIEGMGDALMSGAPDAMPDAGAAPLGGGEVVDTPPPEDELVEPEPEPEAAPEPEPEPAPVVKPKPEPKPDTRAADKARADKSKADKAAQDKAARDKAARDRAAREKAAKDKSNADKAARDRAAREKAARDKAAREKANKDKAAREKAAREKAAREKAERDKAAREKAAREKAAREKAARDKAAKEKAERERAKKFNLGGNGTGNSGGGNSGGSAGKPAAEVKKAARARIGSEVQGYLESCAPSGSDGLLISVTLNLSRDGSLISASVTNVGGVTPYNKTKVEPMKQCAVKALKQASPYKLDPEGYDTWKSLPVTLKPN